MIFVHNEKYPNHWKELQPGLKILLIYGILHWDENKDKNEYRT